MLQANVRKLRNWLLALLVLTTVHHAYGAVIYAAPFRAHVALVALLLGPVLWWLSKASQDDARIGARRALLGVALLTIAGVGLFEGFYNHLLKIILWLIDPRMAALSSLFPAPIYEMPNNLLFEVTGVLQAFVAIPALGVWAKLAIAVKPRSV